MEKANLIQVIVMRVNKEDNEVDQLGK